MGKVNSKARVAESGHVELKSISQHVSDVVHRDHVKSAKRRETEERLLRECARVVANKLLSKLTAGTLTIVPGEKKVLEARVSCRHTYARHLDYHSRHHKFATLKQRIAKTVTEDLPGDIRITELHCWRPSSWADMEEGERFCAGFCPCISLPLFLWRHNLIHCRMQVCCE